MYVYTSVQMKNDPSYRLTDFSPLFLTLSILTLILFTTYLIFLLFLAWRACRSLTFISPRQRFLYYVNVLMALFTIACLCAGFFQRLPSIGALVLIVTSAYNIYIYLLQVMYVPSELGILERNRELELSHTVSQAHKWEDDGETA